MQTLVAFERESERAVMRLGASQGPADLDTFRSRLCSVLAGRPESLVIDMSETATDSDDLQFAYVAVVASSLVNFGMPQRSITLVTPSATVRRVLEAADLDRSIPVLDSVARARGAGAPELVSRFIA